MSVADMQVLLKRIATDLGAELTVNQLNVAMELLAENLDEFDVAYTGECLGGSDELLDTFLATKKMEGKSPKTVERYRYIITKMLNKMQVPVKKINVYHLRHYLADCKEHGLSDRTLNGERNVFCSFFGWLHREGLIETNPSANLSTIKCMKKVRTPLSDTDVERLKECCETDRDKALVSFMLSSGCRISEICALNRNDIDFPHMRCTVLGKGNKERIVYLDSVSIMLLQRYLQSRTDSSPALFAGKGTDRMTPGGVRFRLKTIAERADVTNVHPHRFRRTLATNLINRGMPIQEVATILGHDKIDTTMQYVYVSQENVQAAYRKFA